MIDTFKIKTRGKKSGRKPNQILKRVIIGVVAIMLLNLITLPLRRDWSDNYLVSGQTYLDQKKYLSAELEFEKALFLYSNNTEARTDLDLARKAESDISVLENYFKTRKLDAVTAAFAKAEAVPATPADAVKTAKELIEAGEYQLAIMPALTATEMDSHYESGWQYLGIASLLSSRGVEIGASAKQKYLDRVSSAKTHLSTVPEILK